MTKRLTIILSISIVLSLVLCACTSGVAQPSPSGESITSLSVSPSPSNPPVTSTVTFPRTIEGKYVILQDYADNDTSKFISDSFLSALDDEDSLTGEADEYLKHYGKKQFLLIAAVPFEQGVLVCGHILRDGEDYSDLFYIEEGKITWKAEDSDVWSLNYTVFKNHTIAYGNATGWDNKVVFQRKVAAEFANGKAVSQNFKNIPFKGLKNGWQDGSVQTDGYILVADGLTWVKNIEFFDNNGNVQDDWRSGSYRFVVFDSDKSYIWSGKPNEIWTVYRYTQMLTDSYRSIVNEVTPVSIKYNGENIEVQHFLLNDNIGLEYVWRNNNNYIHALEVKDISEIKIQGIGNGDKVIWAALDNDNGSPISDYSSLCSENTPHKKGVYCLIINHNGNNVLKHENMYYTVFIKLI